MNLLTLIFQTNEDDVVAFKTALQDCKRLGDRICGIVERVMPAKEKTKEPSVTPQKKAIDDDSKDEKSEVNPVGENETTVNGEDHAITDDSKVVNSEDVKTTNVSMEEAKAEEI